MKYLIQIIREFFGELKNIFKNMDRKMKRRAIVFLFSFVGLVAVVVFNGCKENCTAQSIYWAKVVSVVDGDTVDVIFLSSKPYGFNEAERIRLCGVDTPEMHYYSDEEPDFYAKEATNFTRNELVGQEIEVRFDSVSARRDKYGRGVAYIFLEGFNFNRKLISEGYARFYDHFSFEEMMMTDFALAEKEARDNQKGLWGAE